MMHPMPLIGHRILVVEDEAIIALDLKLTLIEAGADVIGPASTLAAGRELAKTPGLSAAILDVRLGEEDVWPIAVYLAELGVPFIIHTGHANDDDLPVQWPRFAVLTKPAGLHEIVATLSALIHTPAV